MAKIKFKQLDPDGYLGIGTIPSYPLHIYSTTASQVLAFFRNNTDAVDLSIKSGSGVVKVMAGSGDALQLSSNATDSPYIYIKSDGNVGIGTSSPSSKLHISGTAPIIQLTDTDTGADSLFDCSNASGSITISADANNEAADSSIFFNLDGSLYASLTTTGFGVGTAETTPAYLFHVAGNADGDYIAKFFNDGNDASRLGILIQCGADDQSSGTHIYLTARDGDGDDEGYLQVKTGTLELAQASDARRKSDIQPSMINGLDIVQSVQVKEFRYKKEFDIGDLHSAGFIAQDVEQYFPEAVSQGRDGFLYLSVERLIPVLWKAIQELMVKVEELSNG